MISSYTARWKADEVVRICDDAMRFVDQAQEARKLGSPAMFHDYMARARALLAIARELILELRA